MPLKQPVDVSPTRQPDPQAGLAVSPQLDERVAALLHQLAALELQKIRLERYQSAQNAVAQILAGASTLDGTISLILQAICEWTGWDFGEIWRVDAKRGSLVCLTNWQSDASKFPEFGHVSKEFTFAPGIGLPGRVWASAQATWIPDVVADRNFLRAPLAAQEGLHSGVGLPVTVRGEVIGVMGFFSHIVRPPEAELLQLLENVGQQVGLLTQRTEDEACAHEQMQLEAALEERLRLAHKLHDNVAQTVFPAAVLAELLPYLWDRDRNRVWYGLNELRQLTHTSLNQAHGLLSHLGGKTLAEADAGELLNRVVKKIASQTRLEVELSVKGECRLPTEAQIALYCIVQEALQNVLQHARATRATIHLHSYPEGTELRIGDNGRGFDLNRVLPDRLGLRIMRECASRFGATFEVTSQLNQGTQVILRWRTAR